jgi:hypothetical protein
MVCGPHLENRLYSFFQMFASGRGIDSSEHGINVMSDFGIRWDFGVRCETDISGFAYQTLGPAVFDAVGNLGEWRRHRNKLTGITGMFRLAKGKVGVKARNATALVLYCGWYLLGAPPPTTGQMSATSAPVSQWTVMDVFDTERDCRDGEREQLNPAKKSTQGPGEMGNQSAALKCISTDDPRLSK